MKHDPNATAIDGGAQAVRVEFDRISLGSVSDFIFQGDEAIVPPPMLVKGLFPYEGVAFIGGQSGAGKTFIVMRLANCLATGAAFFGMAVKEKVGVVIIASEGRGMIAARIEAARRTISPDLDRLPVAWRSDVPTLNTIADIKKFAGRLASVGRHFKLEYGVRLGAIIIDTVAATFQIEDENDNSEAARTIRNMRELSRATGALIIPVHHYGKLAGNGMRGGSAWHAGAEVVVGVLADRTERGVVSNRRLTIEKSRDGVEGPVGSFHLRFIQLDIDEDGEAFGTCVAEPLLGNASPIAGKASAAASENRAYKVFRAAFAEAVDNAGANIRVMGSGPVVRAVRVKDVRAEFNRRYATGEGDAGQRADATRKAFKRVLERLAGQYSTQLQDDEEWIWSIKGGADTPDTPDMSGLSGLSEEGSSDADIPDGQDTPP